MADKKAKESCSPALVPDVAIGEDKGCEKLRTSDRRINTTGMIFKRSDTHHQRQHRSEAEQLAENELESF